jgi:hypothetical protein
MGHNAPMVTQDPAHPFVPNGVGKQPTYRIAHPPRFRAFALFGRRPHQRVDGPSRRHPKTCTKADVAANAEL